MEQLGECDIRVFLPAHFQQDVQKFLAHQEGQHAGLLDIVGVKQHFPVRILAGQQPAEGRHLLGREAQLFLPRRAQAQGVVQEHLVDFRHIARQLIFEFSLVLRLGADNPEHELVLRHSLDIFMHPAGHPAADIRVTAFQYHTNPQFDHSVFRMPAPP